MKVPPDLLVAAAGWSLFIVASIGFGDSPAFGHETGSPHVHFQRPQVGNAPTGNSNAGLQFRSGRTEPRAATPRQAAPPVRAQDGAASPAEAPEASIEPRKATPATKTPSSTQGPRAAPLVISQPPHNDANVRPAYLDAPPAATDRVAAASTPRRRAAQPSRPQAGMPKTGGNARVRQAIATNTQGEMVYRSQVGDRRVQQTGYCDTCYEPACGIGDPSCGIGEPACGIGEPACGIYEPGCTAPGPCDCGVPSCGICNPGCGIGDPSCGLIDPVCGCPDGCGDGVGCGSCVGISGPDYWCFPVCLPRFKYFTVWGGVHGFKGPRDSLLFGGPADANFGFQEGANIGGRAPLLGLLFPQLSYQLGYQAAQSRLSGTSGPAPSGTSIDRTQHFLTGGFFRRAPMGVQWGVVWDMMRDDLVMSQDFHQLRYEASLKSPQGREFGFMGITHTNNKVVAGVDYQPVDQYMLFYRWHFRNAGEGRLWGGGTNDSEGLFGGEFFVPLNNRWSLQTGFNYLITERNAGQVGAREEGWNLGMNLVWHFGRTAKAAQCNPHRPLFQVADNGWMFIDQVP